MKEFTLEFLPHFAGTIKRKADFSLYEINWNDFGKWGFFEFQINCPTNIALQRSVSDRLGYKNIPSDITIRDKNGNWPHKRLQMYEIHQDEILKSISAPYFINVTEHLVLRMLLSFSYEERKQIASQFRFAFPNEELKKIYLSEVSINDLFKKYSKHISINF